jgi:serine/threonine protein kinase
MTPCTRSRDSYDNEVKHWKAESGAGRPDDTQDVDSSMASERPPPAGTGSHLNVLFEDDEDLFRLDSSELINGQHQQQQQQQQQQLDANDNASPQDQQVGGENDNFSDLMDSHANDLLVNSRPITREQQHEAYLDWILDGGDMMRSHPARSFGNDGPPPLPSAGHEPNDREPLSWLPSSASQQQQQQQQQQQLQSADRIGDKKIDDRSPSAANAADGSNSSKNSPSPDDKQRADLGIGRASARTPLDHLHVGYHASLSSMAAGGRARQFSASASASDEPAAGGSAASRSKLAKFVHKIVPEPSCYTGLGEHYRGNASTSTDQRLCLNWAQVRAALSQRPAPPTIGAGQNQTTTSPPSRSVPAQLELNAAVQGIDDNHNHCRNPNNDQRGPWCFVIYSEELDGVLVARPYLSASGQLWKSATSKQRTVRLSLGTGQLFVAAQCQLASCSEYLWLYVVAPPFGLLVLLTCLISLSIRSIRKSHYNAIFSANYHRHGDSSSSSAKSHGLLGKFMQSRRRLVMDEGVMKSPLSPKRKSPRGGYSGSLLSKLLSFSPSAASSSFSPTKRQPPRSRGKYLNDDIFEVVDDIDWSDGQPTTTTSQSLSPSESFRLHSTTATCDDSPVVACRQQSSNNSSNNNSHWTHRSTLTHSKSINPVYGGVDQVASLDLPAAHKFKQQSIASTANNDNNKTQQQHKMSKSKSQVGPMFATLRCHVRNAHQQHQRRLINNDTPPTGSSDNCTHQSTRESSSFIESGGDLLAKPQQKLPAPRNNFESTNHDRTGSSVASNLSSLQTTATISDHSIATTTKTGLLLSYGSSSLNDNNGALATTGGNLNKNSRNEPNEKCTLVRELQKLDASSVTLAYDTPPLYEGKFSQVQMAYIKQRKDDLAQATGRMGAQVAVCSLKQQAALGESVFYPTNLRVHNLNHLNLLKLIGYVQLDNDDQLESTSSNESSIVRPNVKCSLVYDMAHMIDLNDWLKEQSKDTFDTQNDCYLSLRQNLTCLAKQIALALDYLHDKNIIYKDLACRNCFLDVTRMLVKLASFNIELELDTNDDGSTGGVSGSGYSRNTGDGGDDDDDLISKKLSLKSMVRPKYLLDYYVIDSRPAECQLLPLSWISLESILFNKFNKHTDIWSFGCLLYELFSLGEVAYFGYSSKQVIDSVRSNLMPPQPLLCPNGIYKLMCKCLSDIPTLRPNIKHVYEQLNLYSGQCSSFLNHHLCII